MSVQVPRAKSLFLAALENRAPSEWPAYLDEACGGDADLRGRVEALLAAHAQSAGAFDRFAATPGPAEGPGATIGPYRLLEEIGEGGMGVVYRAEQAEPVRREVALKLIRPGMDSRQVIARFEAERQALALMDHPNIARVFDGGTTGAARPTDPPAPPLGKGGPANAPAAGSPPPLAKGGPGGVDPGRPYFVMELVRGLPITDHCDRERLGIPERLELFVLVCRAVQHAHQKGVIHRDLKPSNILVTVIDGVAVPKVIDFGVAKALGEPLTDATLTAFPQIVGTPLYMSPEQAEPGSLDIDTRSDVYALGVLLYELLTGTTPFERETFGKAAFEEMRRILREDEPPKPSTRLSSLGASRATVSANRLADPRTLAHALRGELDWIVMKALEKDRARRYETANDFAADVMRHLTDRPVEACPPSAWYRLRKYVRRNRPALIAAALVATALVTGTGVSAWQAVRATRAEQRATAALEESRLLVDYLVEDVFGSAAPEKTRGRTLTIHDLLAAGEAAIPERFGRRPLVEAAAWHALGRAYTDLVRYDEAQEKFRRVAELRSRHLGPDHPETLAAEEMLVKALCPTGVSLGSKTDVAEPIARRVLEVRRRVLGPGHPRTLASMTALAHVLTVAWFRIVTAPGKYPWALAPNDVLRAEGTPAVSEALALLWPALAGQVRALGPEHPESLQTLDALGRALNGKADFVGAIDVLRRAVDGRRRVLGPVHPATLQSLKHLADAFRGFGETDEANRLYLEAAEGHRETFGPIHIQSSSAWGRLIATLRQSRDAATIRDVCERWLREILASPIAPDPDHRSRRAITLRKCALELATLPASVPFDAELATRAAEEIAAINGGRPSGLLVGVIRCRTGRLDEALQAFQAVERQPNWAGGSDLYWSALAVVHARRGDPARARECLERSRAPETSRDLLRDVVEACRTEAEALLNPDDLPDDVFARP